MGGSERISLHQRLEKAFDALFVEYSTMMRGNISKPTHNVQPSLEDGMKKKHRKGWIKMIKEDLSTHLSMETQLELDQYLMTESH